MLGQDKPKKLSINRPSDASSYHPAIKKWFSGRLHHGVADRKGIKIPNFMIATLLWLRNLDPIESD
jgi:hypothetical protein